MELKALTGCTIVGPTADKERIPGIDICVGDGDSYSLGNGGAIATVFDTPGHTKGHICFYFAEAGKAFVGDTIFSLGCGRLFEGSPEEMWNSIQKLMALPDSTELYCAHEYTMSNGKFALTVEPDNKDLIARVKKVQDLRSQGIPTVPTTLALEKATNPFLRPTSPAIQRELGFDGSDVVEVFAQVRLLKDNF